MTPISVMPFSAFSQINCMAPFKLSHLCLNIMGANAPVNEETHSDEKDGSANDDVIDLDRIDPTLIVSIHYLASFRAFTVAFLQTAQSETLVEPDVLQSGSSQPRTSCWTVSQLFPQQLQTVRNLT
jgi:hypothetical protein